VANKYRLGGERRSGNPLGSILRIFLEIIVIVVGIGIAVTVQNWNDTKKEQLLKLKSLQELRTEASINLQELNADQADRKVQVELFQKMIAAASERVADDTLRMAMDELLKHRFYSGANAAFDNMVASGNLRLITSDSTRAKLFELKQFESKAPLVESNDVQLISNQIEPYLTRRQVLYLLEVQIADNSPQTSVSTEQSARIIRTLLEDRTFIDLIYLRLSRVQQTIYLENPLASKLRDIITQLDYEIDRVQNTD